MTDEEKYRFDLNGYLVIEGALDSAQLAALNAYVDARLAAATEPGKTNYRFGQNLDNDLVRQVIAAPRALEILTTALSRQARLDHDYLDVIMPKAGLGPIGAALHGGGEPYDSGQFYQFKNGKMHNGLVVLAYALKDCNPGDGGFACVPGSHKANLPLPRSWVDMAQGMAPDVRVVTCKAGDAILFTEALTHGTAPWHGADERRTLFLKYAPHFMAWGAGRYDTSAYPDLTDEARALLEAPNYRYQGRRVRD
jgi:ectoine hydroxylase-related dioxygenase (phytanoyl-CoA dioxygenase family)